MFARGNTTFAYTSFSSTSDAPLTPLEQLIDACCNGDAAQARELILQHNLVREMNPNTSRALVDSADTRSFDTPLIAACSRGREAVVAALLELGADVNAATASGITPVFAAVDADYPAIVKTLLANGANTNAAVSHQRWTPLFIAASDGYSRIARVLLDHGVNVDETTTGGATALYLAAQNGHLDIALELLARGANALLASNGATPLHVAASEGHVGVVAALMKHGVNPEARSDERSSTPLHLAVLRRQTRTAAMLLELGADANAKYFNGTTPLHVAARYGFQDAVYVLFEHGADVSAATHCIDDHLPAASELLSNSTHCGMTPLHDAAQHSRKDVVVDLLAHGARVDAVTGVVDQPSTVGGAAEQSQRVPSELLEFGRSMNVAFFGGNSPLHLAAAEAADVEVLEVLMNAGAAVDDTNAQGWTPLQLAAHTCFKENVIQLLKHGANPNTTAGGLTPLHDAAARGNAAIVEALLNHGADADAQAWSGETALQIAVRYERSAVVDVLSAFGSRA